MKKSEGKKKREGGEKDCTILDVRWRPEHASALPILKMTQYVSGHSIVKDFLRRLYISLHKSYSSQKSTDFQRN